MLSRWALANFVCCIIFWVGSCRPSPNKLICQQALLLVCCVRFVTFCASTGLAAVCPFLHLMISQVLEVSASLALGELILKESPKKSWDRKWSLKKKCFRETKCSNSSCASLWVEKVLVWGLARSISVWLPHQGT